MAQEFNIVDYFSKDKQNKIMFSFKGDITEEKVSQILDEMEEKLNVIEEKSLIKKKIYNISVECVQNLYHHLGEITSDLGAEYSAVIYVLTKDEAQYTITTGNCIKNENISSLKQKLEQIKALEHEELKQYYKEVLDNGQVSNKGGAGLGMIDMAMRSRKNFTYSFIEINEKLSIFSLKINIVKKKKS